MSNPSLFARHVIYEHAITKRMRILTRVDYLARQFEHHCTQTSSWDIRAAINTLLELNMLLERNNIKLDLMRELEQRINWLEMLSDVDDVDQKRMSEIITEHQSLLHDVRDMPDPVGEALTKHALINTVRQHARMPGCTSETDLPLYYKWLSDPRVNHTILLRQLFEPFTTVVHTSRTLLEWIRSSAPFHSATATRGWYETALDANRSHQMIRVQLRTDANLYPEISVSNQFCTIMFRNSEALQQRPNQTTEDVEFELSRCLF